MKLPQISTLFAVVVLIIACNTKETKIENEKPEFDIEAVKAHINKANETYVVRFKEDGSNGLKEKLYCKDAVTMPLDDNTVAGRDSVWAYYYGNGEHKNANIIIKATDIYGTDSLVVEEGVYDFPDDKGGSIAKGKFITIWKQEDGMWKMYREIWNNDKRD